MTAGRPLRVLIANERYERLGRLAALLTGLGHEVVGRSVSVSEVAALTTRERPDVALVGLGESREHGLELISEIAREASCPVIAVLHAHDAAWVGEAANRGVFAFIVDARPDELQSAMEITLRRFADLHDLQSAIDRRESEARQALGLHDAVVQGLVVAQLAHDLGREQEFRKALGEALEHAKAAVSRSLQELRSAGFDTGQLIRDSASRAGNAAAPGWPASPDR